MNVVVKKAEIRSSLFLSYEYDQKDAEVSNSIKTASDAPIHDDLRNAFKALIPHFVFICKENTDEKIILDAIENPDDYFGFKDEVKHEDLLNYRVYGFQLGKNDESVTISGAKFLTLGSEIAFTTPKIKFDSTYKFVSELQQAVDTLKQEVLEYMSGKQAEKAQLEMFGEEDEEEFEE
jgi:hypothetical protein